MDERPENTAESKPRKPGNSFPKRSILDSQLSWTHCLLLFEYLGVRGRLLASMPGLIKWDLSFLADRWSGCYTQTSDRLLTLGTAACRCSTRSLSLTAWAGDSFGWSGWWSTQCQTRERWDGCSSDESVFPTPPSLNALEAFITWIQSRFHKAHSYETRLGNKVNYSVVKGNTMMGGNAYFWKPRNRGLSVNFFPWRKFTTILLQSFLNEERIII